MDTPDNKKKVQLALEAACARREYCSGDILKKALLKSEGDKASAAEIVEGLKKNGFVDDARYAGAYAREKSAINGWGPVKIRRFLLAKGIDAQTVSEALETVDNDKADTRLLKLLESKRKSLKDDPAAKLKLLRYALTRGYSYESVAKAVDTVLTKESV